LQVHLTFLCPACGKEVKTDASQAGKRCFCPHCSSEMLVPFIRLDMADRQKAKDLLAARRQRRTTVIMKKTRNADRRVSARWGIEGFRTKIGGKGPYRVVNVNAGGMAVEVPVEETSKLGKVLEVEFENPFHGGKVRLKAEVVWLTVLSGFDGSTPVGDGRVEDRRFVRMGMAFREVSAQQKSVLSAIERTISQ
jgi:DNA-directed RNA polymerase subunit RPC12/RpoP